MKITVFFLALHLFVVSLLPNNNVFELQKLGNLLLHFEHHLTVHQENIDFIDFIALHYFNAEHQQKDHAEHENLPFHQHENTPITKIFFYAPQIVFEVIAIFATFIPEKKHSFFLQSLLPRLSFDIWQPPKIYVV
jgi:hypothetical protein